LDGNAAALTTAPALLRNARREYTSTGLHQAARDRCSRDAVTGHLPLRILRSQVNVLFDEIGWNGSPLQFAFSLT
jgi:hypothetical protein